MKSIKELSWNVSEEEYRNNEAYSYSILAKFEREGFKGLSTLYNRVESPSLLFGSLVDTLLTEPEEFDNKFIVASFPEISDSLKEIAMFLYKQYGSEYNSIDNIPDNILSKVGITFNYYSNSKFDNLRVKKIKEECSYYYQLLILSDNKILISNEDYNEALSCVDILKIDPMTSKYFTDIDIWDNNIERIYQLKFKGEYENILLRGMLDLVVVDHKEKIIYPIDLKTSFKEEYNFPKSFIDWNYHIQAQLYTYLLEETIKSDSYFKDFKVSNYRFVVINKKTKSPLVWEYKDSKAIVDTFYGKNKQYKCRNWRNILKELNYYHSENPKYPIGIGSINDIIEYLNNE